MFFVELADAVDSFHSREKIIWQDRIKEVGL